ncbi:QsdR family transcriptional regulator [Sporichthya polymorpha]|uniref:QsdR family transcriptional regulator n=1 Tax=Sporichthya polymorpha TaxID=35751 RepID=UPI000372763D|nr:QsdR family transcriptional regulator [Sporichthya polymorpha]
MTTSETLGERLAREGDAPRASIGTAFDLACHWFMAGKRVDISALAGEVGVSRVTMHRWVGTRDELLSEVMWHLTNRTLDRLLAEIDAEGISPRAPELLGRYIRAISTNTGVLRLQREEPETFVRLCTTNASPFQRRMIAKVTEVLATDRAAGHLGIDLDDDELAFAVVRLLEAYAHAPTLTGEPADPDRATRVMSALLR